ncbi:hypothetical protein BBP40_011645 [Aspergillus hancockii]|nr:hypothetical protein BBP40_011645 [Aspergillus hancockii]
MDHHTVFPPAQLALAMAIVKQKPINLTIREYILQIRQNIKNSKTADRFYTEDRDKFFDSVSFWQKAYEKSEAEQSKLLDRIYDLERRNEALTARVQGKNPTVEEEQLSLKRKAGGNKKAVGGQNSVLFDELRPLKNSDEATGPFLRQFYTLQKALQKRSCHLGIAKAAVTLCRIAEDEVSTTISKKKVVSCSSKKKESSQTEKRRIVEVLRSVGYGSQFLLQALKALSGSGQDAKHAGHVTYHINLQSFRFQ